MQRNRALHLPLDFVARTPGGNATGKVRRVCGEAGAGLLDDDQVFHGFNPACLRILFRGPGATSSPGLPATVTRPGLFACLNCRCEPRCRTTDQPSFASMSTIANLTIRGTLESQLPWINALAAHAAPWASLSHDVPRARTARRSCPSSLSACTTHRRSGGLKSGHTICRTPQIVRKSTLLMLPIACLGRRGSNGLERPGPSSSPTRGCPGVAIRTR